MKEQTICLHKSNFKEAYYLYYSLSLSFFLSYIFDDRTWNWKETKGYFPNPYIFSVCFRVSLS